MSSFALHLHVTTDKDAPHYPTSDQAAEAARYASTHGELRIAQQLMGLACALADLEARAYADRDLADAVNVPLRGATRDEQPRTVNGPRPAPHLTDTALLVAGRNAADQQPRDQFPQWTNPAPIRPADMIDATTIVYTCAFCQATIEGGEAYATHRAEAHGLDRLDGTTLDM
jgi:hypothetical protein